MRSRYPSCAVTLRGVGRTLRGTASSRFSSSARGRPARRLFLGLRADGTLPTLFAFNDPDAHGDLYALDLRADRNHLNAAGAERLSHQLAQAIAAADAGGTR